MPARRRCPPPARRRATYFATRSPPSTWQDRVDGAPTLDAALDGLDTWLRSHALEHGPPRGDTPRGGDGAGGRSFAFAADGPYDLRYFLDAECTRKRIPKADYFDKWVNVKQLFSDFYKVRVQIFPYTRFTQHTSGPASKSAPPMQVRPCKIAQMLGRQGMRFEGRLHSGIDDARNIARIALRMRRDGCRFYVNEGLPPRPVYKDL